MGDFSEFGYAYLGRHLASRGFITVSIDEDFLNGSWADDWQGSEQLARAWLLLLHLDQWRTWNADPTSPFHGLVDLDRVALMGHSRGRRGRQHRRQPGLTSRPRARARPVAAGLRVRAVVAHRARATASTAAPSSSRTRTCWSCRAATTPTSAAGSGISAVHSHDRHRRRVQGRVLGVPRQSRPVQHGLGPQRLGPERRGPAEPRAAPRSRGQEDIARTTIGAFLEASLHGIDGYRGLFQRPMTGRAVAARRHLPRSLRRRPSSRSPCRSLDPPTA